jgi:hypothetical protein
MPAPKRKPEEHPMSISSADPFGLSIDQLRTLLQPNAPLFPELEDARGKPTALRDQPATRFVLAQTQPLMDAIAEIPATRYTDYRLFRTTGDRKRYEAAYFHRRANLAAAALHLFLGQAELKPIVQDHIWAICEESTWVVPAHEIRPAIDLFAAETGFALAETLLLLGETLDAEVRSRVRQEVERRIFAPYLHMHAAHSWYQGRNNWNGVCNGSVAATFLLLEPEPGRVARAVELALSSLAVYLETAFEEDGSSTEGVGYWHYGLSNVVALAEMLRARSDGALDLLDSDRMRRIAAYPLKLRLSGTQFASFSDSDESVKFHPGMMTRLALRTGEQSLRGLVPSPSEAEARSLRSFPMLLRNMLWWDGDTSAIAPKEVDDAVLPSGGVARLVAGTGDGAPVVVAIKAGHNDENHNQNDVGSFVLHVAGETLLVDPGRGLYNRDYFGPRRYENIFANSYGHSVPRIGGRLQAAGPEFRGELLGVTAEDDPSSAKQVTVEFARAYAGTGLEQARRRLWLAVDGEGAGTVWLHDAFRFASDPLEVEEALVTWLDVEVDGPAALLRGRNHALRLIIEAPADARFERERLEEESRANAKPAILTRLRFRLPVCLMQEARVRMEIIPA